MPTEPTHPDPTDPPGGDAAAEQASELAEGHGAGGPVTKPGGSKPAEAGQGRPSAGGEQDGA